MTQADSEQHVELYRFLGPKTDKDAARLKNVLLELGDALDSATVLPTHSYDAPKELLLDTGHYSEDAVLLSGVVLRVKGSLHITQSNVHLILNDRSGTGVSTYNITTALSRSNIQSRFETARKAKRLPQIGAIKQTHKIAVTQFDNEFAIVVTANDSPAAVKLLEMILDTPHTVEELVASPDYENLLNTSQLYRDHLAMKLAWALGVTVEPTATTTALTHSIVEQGDVYAIYHDAYVPDSGSVMVSSGPTGDYAKLFVHPDGEAVNTRTEIYNQAIHKTPAVRFDANTVAFIASLPSQPHLQADDLYASHDEPAVVEQLSNNNQVIATSKKYEHIVAILPNVFVDNMSTEQLIQLARTTTAKSIPVAANHPVVALVPIVMDELKSKRLVPNDYTITRALSSEYREQALDILVVHSDHPETNAKIEKELAVVTLPTVSTSARPRNYYTHRRYRRGYSTALTLDVAFLIALGALDPRVYRRRYYPRRPPFYYDYY